MRFLTYAESHFIRSSKGVALNNSTEIPLRLASALAPIAAVGFPNHGRRKQVFEKQPDLHVSAVSLLNLEQDWQPTRCQQQSTDHSQIRITRQLRGFRRYKPGEACAQCDQVLRC